MTKRSSNSRIWNEARTRIAISLSVWPLALQLLDLLADAARFLFGIPGAGDGHLLAGHVLGAQRLAEPAFVVRDQMRGGGEDVAGGAVIALEPDHLGAGKIVLEAQDVVDLGAAPAIDRLVVVADAADVFGRCVVRSGSAARAPGESRSAAARIRARACRLAPELTATGRLARSSRCDSSRSQRYCATLVS